MIRSSDGDTKNNMNPKPGPMRERTRGKRGSEDRTMERFRCFVLGVLLS